MKICAHVKKHDPNAKVKFFFGVSSAAYDQWGSNWQSFDIGDNKQCAFKNLSKKKRDALNNLEQYVLSPTGKIWVLVQAL